MELAIDKSPSLTVRLTQVPRWSVPTRISIRANIIYEEAKMRSIQSYLKATVVELAIEGLSVIGSERYTIDEVITPELEGEREDRVFRHLIISA